MKSSCLERYSLSWQNTTKREVLGIKLKLKLSDILIVKRVIALLGSDVEQPNLKRDITLAHETIDKIILSLMPGDGEIAETAKKLGIPQPPLNKTSPNDNLHHNVDIQKIPSKITTDQEFETAFKKELDEYFEQEHKNRLAGVLDDVDCSCRIFNISCTEKDIEEAIECMEDDIEDAEDERIDGEDSILIDAYIKTRFLIIHALNMLRTRQASRIISHWTVKENVFSCHHCNKDAHKCTPFCPNCGARMES